MFSSAQLRGVVVYYKGVEGVEGEGTESYSGQDTGKKKSIQATVRAYIPRGSVSLSYLNARSFTFKARGKAIPYSYYADLFPLSLIFDFTI